MLKTLALKIAMSRILPFLVMFMTILGAAHALLILSPFRAMYPWRFFLTVAWLLLPNGMFKRKGPLTLFAYFGLVFLHHALVYGG